MTIEEGVFRAEDGIKLFYRFQAGSRDREPILLVHGHGEHSGRYLKFFTRLQDLDHSIATFDLRGCGRSEGIPVYVSQFEDYLSDLSTFVRFLIRKFQIRTSLYLFGHSLGGLIAATWALERSDTVSKLILSSPLFGIPLARPLKMLVNFLDRVSPRFVIRNPIRPIFLTHDPEEIEKYQKDPLIRRRITIRLVHEMLNYVTFFQEKEILFRCPVFVLMAEQDFIVDPKAARQVFQRLQAPVKELVSFPGFFHEIFNERGQEKVFERLRYYLGR